MKLALGLFLIVSLTLLGLYYGGQVDPAGGGTPIQAVPAGADAVTALRQVFAHDPELSQHRDWYWDEIDACTQPEDCGLQRWWIYDIEAGKLGKDMTFRGTIEVIQREGRWFYTLVDN